MRIDAPRNRQDGSPSRGIVASSTDLFVEGPMRDLALSRGKVRMIRTLLVLVHQRAITSITMVELTFIATTRAARTSATEILGRSNCTAIDFTGRRINVSSNQINRKR